MIIDVLGGGPAPLVVVADDDGTVVASGSLGGPGRRPGAAGGEPSRPVAGRPGSLGRLPGGDVTALDRVAVRQVGSPVRTEVWTALRGIPAGEPVSYGELADVIGRPLAARAVGSACGANHVAPFVPCHRVIAGNGSLGGYGYGLPIKRWLLDHEARSRASGRRSRPGLWRRSRRRDRAER